MAISLHEASVATQARRFLENSPAYAPTLAWKLLHLLEREALAFLVCGVQLFLTDLLDLDLELLFLVAELEDEGEGLAVDRVGAVELQSTALRDELAVVLEFDDGAFGESPFRDLDRLPFADDEFLVV